MTDPKESTAFLPRLIQALEIADQRVPHTAAHDDAMDDVWDLVVEYKLAQ